MSNIDDLDKILKKYKYSEPIPEEVQKKFLNGKKRSLNKVLKKLNKHSFFYSMVIVLFFLFRKFGLKLSIFQTTVVTGSVASIIVGSAGAGTYVGAKKAVEYYKSIEQKTEIPQKTDQTIELNDEKQVVIKKSPVKKEINTGQIEIGKFVSTNVDNQLVKKIKLTLASKLTDFYLKKKGNKKVEKTTELLGSVEKINNIYILSIRGIQKSTGKIVYVVSETANNNNQALIKTEKIAKNIASKLY